MVDVDDLINRITVDAALRAEKAAKAALNIEKILGDKKLTSYTYTDEPIIKTASQMEGYLPEAYTRMRALAHSPEAFEHSRAWLFYQQAKLMAAHTDDVPFGGDFERYFPVYRDMNDRQLRGYFSFRTAVRCGEINKTASSFAYVYIYELLHCIGVQSPEEAFFKLRDFWKAYRAFLPSMDKYMREWLHDFVVYYGLDQQLLREVCDCSFDDALLVLTAHKKHDADTLFDSICVFSTYAIRHSAFYKAYPEDVKRVVCAVYEALCNHHEKCCKNTFAERLFGRKTAFVCTLFSSAVFYDHQKYKEYVYEVSPVQTYYCRNGSWLCEKFFAGQRKSKELGHILKTIDRRMREAYAFPQLLKAEEDKKLLARIVDTAVCEVLQERKRREARRVRIDFTKLHDIRINAADIRDKLLTEEDVKEELQPVLLIPQKEETVSTGILGVSEYRFMQCLLYGRPYESLLAEKRLMPSLLADAVNEKLFEEFGDTVIEFEGDTPRVIEDYTEQLKGWITP